MLDKNGKEAVAGDRVQTYFGELFYLCPESDGKLYGYPLPNGQLDYSHNVAYNFDFDKNDFVVMPL